MQDLSKAWYYCALILIMITNPHIQRYIAPIIEELKQLTSSVDLPQLAERLDPLIHQIQRNAIEAPNPSPTVFGCVYGLPDAREATVIAQYFSDSGIEPGLLSQNIVQKLAMTNSLLHWYANGVAADFEQLAQSKAVSGIFFVTASALPDSAAVLDHIACCAEMLPVITIVSDFSWPDLVSERQRINALHIRLDSWEQANVTTIAQDIAILTESKTAEVIQAASLGVSIGKAAQLSLQILQQAEFNIKIKRQQLLQEEALNKSRGGYDIFGSNELKNKISLQLEQYERRADISNDTEIAGMGSRIFRLMDAAIDQLPALTEEKRAKNIAFVIPEAYKQELLEYFRQLLVGYSIQSRNAAAEFSRLLNTQIHQYLADHHLTLTLPAPNLPDDARIDEMVHHTARFERNYEGTATKKKPTEMMSGARMYFMMFMMIAGMLGMATEIRKHPEYFMPFTIAIVGFGVWVYMDTQRKEMLENREKFAVAAKESLRGEVKRIIQDYSRQWEQANNIPLTDWVKLMERETQHSADVAQKQAQSIRESEIARTKGISDGLKNQESLLQKAIGNKNTLDKNLNRAKNDIQGLLRTQLVKFRVASPASTSSSERESRSRTTIS